MTRLGAVADVGDLSQRGQAVCQKGNGLTL
jgi:hypothetical protein